NFIAPSLDYLGLGNAGTLEIVNTGQQLPNVDFVYQGTALSDTLTVNGATVTLNAQIPVILTDINALTPAGLDGDDTFNVPTVAPFTEIHLDGGNPSASDTLNYNAVPDATTNANFNTAAITSNAAGATTVSFVGVETINVLGTNNAADHF